MDLDRRADAPGQTKQTMLALLNKLRENDALLRVDGMELQQPAVPPAPASPENVSDSEVHPDHLYRHDQDSISGATQRSGQFHGLQAQASDRVANLKRVPGSPDPETTYVDAVQATTTPFSPPLKL